MVKLKKKVDSQSKEPAKVLVGQDERLSVADILGVEHHGGWIYAFILAVIAVAVLITAVGVVGQAQRSHELYRDLSKLQEEFRQLQTDNQRMLIEQQAFSVTPQMIHRATGELGMFYPTFSDRMVIQINPMLVTHESMAVASQPMVQLASGVSQ